jgi:hypothetical protein
VLSWLELNSADWTDLYRRLLAAWALLMRPHSWADWPTHSAAGQQTAESG